MTSECLQQCRKLSRLTAISTFAKARCETGIFRPSGRTRYCKKSSGEGQLSRGFSRFWIEPRASTSALPAASAEKACALHLTKHQHSSHRSTERCGEAQAYMQGLHVKAKSKKVVFLSHRQDWLLLQAKFESVETMLALNMYSPIYACKTYMLVKEKLSTLFQGPYRLISMG